MTSRRFAAMVPRRLRKRPGPSWGCWLPERSIRKLCAAASITWFETQNADGTWDEPWFTGTGFPRVFFLKYHLYRIYFPLMALARYARMLQTG